MDLLVGASESRIDRFAFEGEDAEDTFMDATQGFIADKPLQCLDAQSELSQGQRALAAEPSGAKPRDIFLGHIIGAVNDSQVFPTTAFHRRLNQSLLARDDEFEWFDNHPLAA